MKTRGHGVTEGGRERGRVAVRERERGAERERGEIHEVYTILSR
jgi:hypothetical protein